MSDRYKDYEYDIIKYKLANDALSIALWDMEVITPDPASPLNKITWSKEIRNILGFSDEKDFPNTIEAFANRFHTEDSAKAFAAFAAHFNDCSGETPYDIEYRLKLKSGEYHWFRGFGSTLRDDNGVALRVAGAVIDINERKLTEKRLLIRDVMLSALNEVSAILLSQEAEISENDFDNIIHNCVGIIAKTVYADRSSLWVNSIKNGQLHCTRINEWYKNSEADIKKYAHLESSYDDVIPGWKETLSSGHNINTFVEDMPEEIQEHMKIQDILSLCVMPIIVSGKFWGYIGFDFCHKGRLLENNELDILKSFGLMLANAINRFEQNIKLKESYERARVIMQASPIGTTLWDKDGNMFDCNEAYLRLFNLSSLQEFIERHYEFNTEYQPDGWLSTDKITAMVKKAFIEEGEITFDWLHRTSDGTEIPCNVKMSRVIYEGNFVVAGYLLDLREHKAIMDVIERRDKLLYTSNNVAGYLLESGINNFEEELINCMEVISKVIGADRSSIWINSVKDGHLYCTQIYEWLEDAESQINKDITTEVSYNDVIPSWKERLSNGKNINCLVRDMPDAEQEQFRKQDIKSLCVTPIFIHGRFWGYIGFDYCSEERILDEIEQEIMRSCGLMIANAMLRNEALVNLESALKSANSASKAKSNFLSNMSHEMRTPMNAIVGMVTIGKNAKKIEEKNLALDKINEASSHLLGVINDVLDMAKIEANKFELVPIEYNFEKMLKKVLTIINFRLAEKQQTISVNIDSKIPRFVIGDNQRLAQIITNLLYNSVKFTSEGGRIGLDVSLLGMDGDICELRIEVSDNGIGISPKNQENLFKAFEQGESGINRKYGGTGLGLSISKKSVELMDGKIWVESKLGEGSKFIFTVKMQRGAGFVESIEEEKIGKKDKIFAGKRALLAEDIKINQEVFVALLKDTGLIIDCAEDGFEALEMVADAPEKYDIIFMDLQMPVMNGFESTRRIRALPALKDVRLPIIALTANVFKSDINACFAVGMNDHIGKPIDIDKVLEILRKYLLINK